MFQFLFSQQKFMASTPTNNLSAMSSRSPHCMCVPGVDADANDARKSDIWCLIALLNVDADADEASRWYTATRAEKCFLLSLELLFLEKPLLNWIQHRHIFFMCHRTTVFSICSLTSHRCPCLLTAIDIGTVFCFVKFHRILRHELLALQAGAREHFVARLLRSLVLGQGNRVRWGSTEQLLGEFWRLPHFVEAL